MSMNVIQNEPNERIRDVGDNTDNMNKTRNRVQVPQRPSYNANLRFIIARAKRKLVVNGFRNIDDRTSYLLSLNPFVNELRLLIRYRDFSKNKYDL